MPRNPSWTAFRTSAAVSSFFQAVPYRIPGLRTMAPAAEGLGVFARDDATDGVRVVHKHDRGDVPGVGIEIEHVGAIERYARPILQRPVVQVVGDGAQVTFGA